MPEDPAGSRPPRAMLLVAGVLALLVVAALVGPRLFRAAAPRAASPAAAGAPGGVRLASPDPAECRLPVVVTDSHALAGAPAVDPMREFPTALPTDTAGFVSLSTGQFVADPTAKGRGMPFSRIYAKEQWTPESYDPLLKRWLPAGPRQVSPDRRSYLYTTQHPLATGKGSSFDSTSLSVFDVATGGDRTLWTSPDQIGPDATWEADGIHASTVPAGGGQLRSWLVDPLTGAVTPVTPAVPRGLPPTAYGMTAGAGFGFDGAGRPILLDGSRNPGAHQEYFVGGPEGQRIVIHTGTAGDAFGFDPDGFAVDGDRLWAANYDGTAIWLWTEKAGLKRFALSGVAQHDPYVTPRVVGPCV
ncbi:MAG TPA: hypothetical protein VE953_27565 [Terriglobales bacterium]|nr:hypothetical protein [Terriglobales bacterium]